MTKVIRDKISLYAIAPLIILTRPQGTRIYSDKRRFTPKLGSWPEIGETIINRISRIYDAVPFN